MVRLWRFWIVVLIPELIEINIVLVFQISAFFAKLLAKNECENQSETNIKTRGVSFNKSFLIGYRNNFWRKVSRKMLKFE
jgi:hypothetical protein